MIYQIEKTVAYFNNKNEIVGYRNPFTNQFVKCNKTIEAVEMLVDYVNILIDKISELEKVVIANAKILEEK